MSWRRVRTSSRCPVCGRADWCSISGDGAVVVCMRVSSDHRTRNGGWLHKLSSTSAAPRQVTYHAPPATRHDLSLLVGRYRTSINRDRLNVFARELGVSVESLDRLGIGWSPDHNAWAFPMLDMGGTPVGIRLRTPAGRKFAVSGGHEGLFIPAGLRTERLLVCEGPTDTAALLDLGFDAVGRPSCTGGVRLLTELVEAMQPAEVVIVADGDAPGQCGAVSLASVLRLFCARVRMVTPPAAVKDARAWKRAGATTHDVEAAIAATATRRLVVTSGR